MSISILNRGASGGMAASIFVNGLSEADTVTASNGSKVKNGVWSQKTSPAFVLPDGYKQLDYIESTGTQWIDTNLMVQTGYTAEVDFQLMKKPNISNNGYIEAWILASSYPQGFRCGVASGGSAFYTGSNFSYSQTNILERTVATGTCPQNNTITTHLFNQNDTTPQTNNAYFKLFSCKIADASGDFVRDFIPCINPSGEVGLYDLASGVFYGNSGTGTFVAGAEIPQYIGYHEINGIKDLGVWTVTATNGKVTSVQDVLIEVIGLYEIEMDYRHYLYNEGDECAENSGGWTEVKWRGALSTLTREKQADCLYAYGTAYSDTGSFFGWSTANKINLSGFTKIKAIVSFTNLRVYLTSNIVNASAGDNSIKNSPTTVGTELAIGDGENMEITYDVSNITADAYIQFTVLASDNSTSWMKVHKVWLE